MSIVSLDGSAVKSGRAVAAGDRVEAGETVVVEDGSAAVIKIRDRASLRLKNAGKLVFDDVSDTISLNLDYGTLMSVVSKANRTFVLRTPAATVGVRGTAFYVEARSIDQTYLCLCEGVVTLTMQDTAQEYRSADRSHHTPLLVSSDKSGALAAAPSTMINHTNADIAALEGVLNR